MAKQSIAQGTGEATEEKRECAWCGARPKRLMMDIPPYLSLKEKQEYKGKFYCLSHLPQSQELPLKGVGQVVL